MFETNKWVMADYIVDDDGYDDLQFLNIYLAIKDIYLNLPEEITVTDKMEHIRYDYDTFINDIYESFESYDDIQSQAFKDIYRSKISINNKYIPKDNSYKEIIKIMNKYKLSQYEKYVILMLSTQAVLACPYYHISNQYKDLHLGELNDNDNINDTKSMNINYILSNSSCKMNITKYLRLFDICDGIDITKKIFKLTLIINLKKKKINVKIMVI